MMTKNEYLIAQMKLHELRQQRPRLTQTYRDLEQQAEHMPTKMQQLQTLFTGLREIKMAEIALHPDVANLEPLLNGPQLSEETIAFWRSRLAEELPQGRLRSELIYIFGALLEEWVQEKSQGAAPDPVGIQTFTQLVERATQPETTAPDLSLLDALFAERNMMGKPIASWFQRSASTVLQERITTDELCAVLKDLSISPHRTATIHRQAKSFLQDTIMCKEMAEALSILLTHLDEWDWPAEGVHAYPFWTMNKWRLFITYDLFTMCFLEILGARLQSAFQQFLTEEREERSKQLRELLEETPGEDREAVLQQSLFLCRFADSDIWADLLAHPETPPTRADLKAHFTQSLYVSIIHKRKLIRKGLQAASTTLGGYEAHSSIDGMKTTLQFINAEIQLARTAFPETPLYVLKLDVKDFYPSLSHDLLLAILERYGFSQSQLTFFRKFLQVHVHQGEGETREIHYWARGVPLHHRLSNALGEMVLHLLDQHLLRNARVRIIRLVDDVCILTPSAEEAIKAWQAAQEFCQRIGLTINPEKCGAVCIGGTLPAQLPTSQPEWLLVKLNQDGSWQIDMEAFATYLQQARQQVLPSSSLLTQIEVYNLHMKHLIRALAMESDLGETHRRSIGVAAAQFHQAFFGEGQGMVEALRQAIQKRFLDNDTAMALPEAWFYWPITAGGCGLTHIMVLASGYAENRATVSERVVPTKRTATWQREYNDWSIFYSSFTGDVCLKEPAATNSMEVLVNDFIQRSHELGNSKQTTLSPYWRWILYIYGPQILERLGTFRFLSTELVPLQIILQHYQQTLSSEDADNDNDNLGDLDDHPF